jgi:hypothetical protein
LRVVVHAHCLLVVQASGAPSRKVASADDRCLGTLAPSYGRRKKASDQPRSPMSY